MKPEKCEFEQTSTEYLGLIIRNRRIKMDLMKVDVITNWNIPKNKKALQSFLGFCNFYRRFIKDFSGIAKPLTKLTGNAEWEWNTEQTDAFELLKKAITSKPVLVILNDHGQFRLEADASNYAIGGVLSQFQDDKWHPVAFFSKSLNNTERNYKIYDKELMAIMTCLSEWRQYLMGARQKFLIWTDHENLTFFQKPQKLNRRQARWFTELAEYDFILIHRPGHTMGRPDTLSQKDGLKKGENDNKDITLLKPHLFDY